MIAYYVNNSIHQIPSFIYIAKALGGVVLTDGPDSFKVLKNEFSDIKSEFYPTMKELRDRLEQLRPEAVVQPDYTKDQLGLKFDTVHVQVFHGTSDKTYNLWYVVKDYDLVLIPGERTYQTMDKAKLLRPNHYAVTGYPKTDRVFRGELNKNAAVQRLGLNPNLPTILYAPTWRDNKQNSSLPKFGEEVLSLAPDNYNLIVKLHPNTKHYDRKYYGMVERLAAANSHIKLLGFEYDVIPVMAAAELLICDISSVSHEFLCFDRPLVFLDPRVIPIGKLKTWVWKCGPVVKKRGEVWKTVAQALAEPGKYAKERKEAREAIYFKPDGHAAERAAEAIRAYIAKQKLEV